MYSDSVDESATVDCFLELQEMGPPTSVNIYPEVEQAISECGPAQSASQ